MFTMLYKVVVMFTLWKSEILVTLRKYRSEESVKSEGCAVDQIQQGYCLDVCNNVLNFVLENVY